MRKIFCFFISLLLFSCAEKSVKNKYYGKFDNNCSIQILGKKDIIIDENFSPTSMNYQYIMLMIILYISLIMIKV